MGKGGGGGGKTTTQTTTPWWGIQPYLARITDKPELKGQPLKGLYSDAQQWYEGNIPQFYPDTTIAPQSPETEAALQVRAMRG